MTKHEKIPNVSAIWIVIPRRDLIEDGDISLRNIGGITENEPHDMPTRNLPRKKLAM